MKNKYYIYGTGLIFFLVTSQGCSSVINNDKNDIKIHCWNSSKSKKDAEKKDIKEKNKVPGALNPANQEESLKLKAGIESKILDRFKLIKDTEDKDNLGVYNVKLNLFSKIPFDVAIKNEDDFKYACSKYIEYLECIAKLADQKEDYSEIAYVYTTLQNVFIFYMFTPLQQGYYGSLWNLKFDVFRISCFDRSKEIFQKYLKEYKEYLEARKENNQTYHEILEGEYKKNMKNESIQKFQQLLNDHVLKGVGKEPETAIDEESEDESLSSLDSEKEKEIEEWMKKQSAYKSRSKIRP